MAGGTFRSLAVPNYRLWFFGSSLSNVGHWMQGTALHWTVLTVLSDGDAGAMGVALALQFAPPLFLAGITGMVADRFDRRRLLMVTQGMLLVVGVTIGALLLLDVMTLWGMYGFAMLLGTATAFDQPARQAFVSDLVSGEDTPNAVALNAASMNAARLVGPAVAGLVIVAVGTGWVFMVNGVAFVGTIGALLIMRADWLVPRVRDGSKMRLAEGVRYVIGRPDLVVAFMMVFLMSTFAMNFPIFGSTMAIEFGRDADGYGIVSSSLGVGALAGALVAAARARARMHVLIGSTLLFTVSAAASAVMPDFWSYTVAAGVTGFAVVTMMTTSNGYIQTMTDAAVRGRVLALYIALLMGGTLFGSPAIGWIASQYGPRTAILVGATGTLVAFVIGASWLIGSGRIRRHPERRLALTLGEPDVLLASGTAGPEGRPAG